VPLIVEYETFWTRYFYRLHKLKQVEEARAGLVKSEYTVLIILEAKFKEKLPKMEMSLHCRGGPQS
jgi:hypothetical protein